MLKLFAIVLIMAPLASAQDQPAPSIEDVLSQIPSDQPTLDSVLHPPLFIPGIGTGLSGAASGPVYKVGPGVRAPRALDTPDPRYSEEARRKRIEGKVVLWMVIGPNGLPRNIRVAKSMGYGLDEAAVEAVRNWRFKPATKEGKPVAVQVNVEVNFRL